jgi:hypothetical protein
MKIHSLLLGVLSSLFCSHALAQTPPAVATKSLESLRVTYHAELKKIHSPILVEYLTELTKLRATSLKSWFFGQNRGIGNE